MSARRDLGSSSNATLTGRTKYVDGADDGDSNEYLVRFSLGKALSSRTSASLDLGYRDYDTDGSNGSFTEKRIGISLTTQLF